MIWTWQVDVEVDILIGEEVLVDHYCDYVGSDQAESAIQVALNSMSLLPEDMGRPFWSSAPDFRRRATTIERANRHQLGILQAARPRATRLGALIKGTLPTAYDRLLLEDVL